jgi:hypothetical protein
LLDAVDTWLLTAWPLRLHGEGRPYLWYEPVPGPVPQSDV